jgi:hypothetical protein
LGYYAVAGTSIASGSSSLIINILIIVLAILFIIGLNIVAASRRGREKRTRR